MLSSKILQLYFTTPVWGPHLRIHIQHTYVSQTALCHKQNDLELPPGTYSAVDGNCPLKASAHLLTVSRPFLQGHVVMGNNAVSPYQQVIEKTKSLSFRSQMLVMNIEKKQAQSSKAEVRSVRRRQPFPRVAPHPSPTEGRPFNPSDSSGRSTREAVQSDSNDRPGTEQARRKNVDEQPSAELPLHEISQ